MIVVLVAGACSTDPAPLPSTSPATTSFVAPSPSTAAEPDRILSRVVVTRTGDQLSFAALWTWGSGRAHRELVIGTGGDVRRTAAPHDGDIRAAFPVPEPSDGIEASQVLGPRLLSLVVPSLRQGTRVAIGGGDGATLLPFEKVAVSEEYDDWSVARLPRFEGERAYVSGGVLLRDGRLLVLLDHFSDDRAGRPSDRHHGLWASADSRLGRYAPYRPRFVPALVPPADGWGPLVSVSATTDPDPVVWATTWDQRVYVSTDGARRFRRLAVD